MHGRQVSGTIRVCKVSFKDISKLPGPSWNLHVYKASFQPCPGNLVSWKLINFNNLQGPCNFQDCPEN